MRSVVSFFLFFACLSVFANDSGKWELIDDDEDLKLYTRAVPNSKIKEVKAEAFIKGTIKEACDILFEAYRVIKGFSYKSFIIAHLLLIYKI